MKSETEETRSAISRNTHRMRNVGCILLCIWMFFSMTGCFAEKGKTDAVITSGGNSYSVKNLDFCKISDKEMCSLVSVDSAYSTIAIGVLIYAPPLSADMSNASRETVLLYDMEGTRKSQINVLDKIGSDKVIVDTAIDASGNLAVLARAQGSDNAVHNYLYAFSAAGILAGDPIELAFGESFLPMKFVIGTDGNMFFSNYAGIGKSAGQIDVLDSKGNMLFVISNSRIAGNLYQTDDRIYTGSNIGGTDSGNSAQLLPIDTVSRKLGDSIDISKVTSPGGAVYSGSDGFYLMNDAGIYSVNLNSQDTKELILWKDADTDLNEGTSDIFPAVVISSDRILLLSSESSAADGNTSVTASLLIRKG